MLFYKLRQSFADDFKFVVNRTRVFRRTSVQTEAALRENPRAINEDYYLVDCYAFLFFNIEEETALLSSCGSKNIFAAKLLQ